MLPDFIIEELKKREQARKQQHQLEIQLEIPLPPPPSKPPPDLDDIDRGVVTIDCF